MNNDNQSNNFVIWLGILGSICSILGISIWGIYNSLTKDTPINSDSEDLLIEAEKYYKMEEYSKVYKIYTLDSMQTNSIALTNLAYFYENGIFVSQDISLAKELYDKAYKLDNKDALENWVKFNIKYPDEMFINHLWEAYNLGSNTVCDFIYEYLDSAHKNEDAILHFFSITSDEQFVFLLNRTYEERVCDEAIEIIAPKYIINKEHVVEEEEHFMGTYEEETNAENKYPDLDNIMSVTPLYGKTIKSSLYYTRFFFTFSRYNPTEFVYIENVK